MDSIDEQCVELKDFFDYDILGFEAVYFGRQTLIFRAGSVVSILHEYGGSGIRAD